jgi:hypothetical protein
MRLDLWAGAEQAERTVPADGYLSSQRHFVDKPYG